MGGARSGAVSRSRCAALPGLPAAGTCLWPGDCLMHLPYVCVLILRICRCLNKRLRTFELSGKSSKDGFISFGAGPAFLCS